MAMKRLLAFAACGLMLAPGTPALAWGSMTVPIPYIGNFNTHGCIAETAYAFVEKDPAFNSAMFPAEADVTGHEGVNVHVKGAGPDSEGSTNYAEHYYNPRNGEGSAPDSVAKYFSDLAYRNTGRQKGAAWSAHFLGDMSVPFHTHGMWGNEVRAAMASNPAALDLPPKVTGDRTILSHPFTGLLSNHSADFKVEAQRFLAATGGLAYQDWFDPWYWNGPDALPYQGSSHITWEGWAPECPPTPVSQYSSLWPGNPPPAFGNPIVPMAEVVRAFAKANARSTVASEADFLANEGEGEDQAATSVATLWRASFSGLRTDQSYTFDQASLADPNATPLAEVRGRLGNFARETARGVQVRLRVVSGACRVKTSATPDIQTYGAAPTGVRAFGDWKVEVPRGSPCRLIIEAIGAYSATPDLEIGWKNFDVTPPNAPPPPPSSDCNCKPGDLMCHTLCHHNAGTPAP